MKTFMDLKEVLEEQLKRVSKKGDISPTELESVYKAVKTIKNIDELTMMENESEMGGMSNRDEYSQANYSRHMPMGPIWNREKYYGNDSYNEGSYEGNSRDNSYRGSYDDRGNGNDGRYSEEGSFRRGRDARGRYTSRDGGSYNYSNAEGKEQMVKQLEEMMQDTQSEKERTAIRQCIEKLEG